MNLIYDIMLFPDELKLPKYRPFIMVAFSWGNPDTAETMDSIFEGIKPRIAYNTSHFRELISKN